MQTDIPLKKLWETLGLFFQPELPETREGLPKLGRSRDVTGKVNIIQSLIHRNSR